MRWGLFTHRGKPNKKKLYCSFCGKDSNNVKALIAGPTVFICDECVGVCNKYLGGEVPPAPEPQWDKWPDAELLDRLTRSSAIADAASDFLGKHVDALRKRGVAWAEIGKALGVSRQAAWERFS